MILLRLYWEFFKTGLFAIGGGMATLPFLKVMGESMGWFTNAELMNMLAVSESTPGPIGINMATYVGFTVAGLPGAVIATLGIITPCVIIILLVAAVLDRFRASRLVNDAFYGLRPASTGLIGAACAGVVLEVLTRVKTAAPAAGVVKSFSLTGSPLRWQSIALAAVLLVLTNFVKPAKKWHPIVFILFSAAVGVAAGALGFPFGA